MNGFCSTPGHQDRPGRLYASGWRCERCAPGPAVKMIPHNGDTAKAAKIRAAFRDLTGETP